LPDYTREGADLNVILPSSQQIPTAVSAFVDFATAKLQTMMESMVPGGVQTGEGPTE
jgi:hypothetical protein